MKDLTLSIEQMNDLKRLGLNVDDASMIMVPVGDLSEPVWETRVATQWNKDFMNSINNTWQISSLGVQASFVYTFQDIIDKLKTIKVYSDLYDMMIPVRVVVETSNKFVHIRVSGDGHCLFNVDGNDELKVGYEILIECLKAGLFNKQY